MTAASRVSAVDLRPGEDGPAVRAAIERVITGGQYILGPETEAFESEFAAACGAAFAIGVASGTDAITLLLRASGIGPGDEVVVPAMTAAYTGLAVVAAGARPVIADVERDTLTLDPAACEAAITSRTRAIVPVHLYGQVAAMRAIARLARDHALLVVEDCCQAHLATLDGAPAGSFGVGGAFSFYPTKNLGALGDGGAVTTNDRAIAERVRRLRNGGQSSRAVHAEAGVNSRLDELQAAVLRARLAYLPRRTARRRELAAAYRRLLPPSVHAMRERGTGHVYHVFAVRARERDALRAHLDAAGVDTLVHYPVALSDQPAFAPYGPAHCPVASEASHELVSLPLHPSLADADVERVAGAVAAFERGRVPA